MKVFSLIGSCGAGKSTILDSMPSDIRTHKEGYVKQDNDEFFIDNKLYISKFRYVNSWFNSILNLKKKGHKRVISDRCPYDVAAYVHDPNIWFNLVEEAMNELRIFGVENFTIFLKSDLALVQDRVKNRLNRDVWRKKYHEDDKKFVEYTWRYFENRVNHWDFVVENNGSIDDAIEEVSEIVQKN